MPRGWVTQRGADYSEWGSRFKERAFNWLGALVMARSFGRIGFVFFNDGNLVFAAEPATEVNQLAARGAEGKRGCRLGAVGLVHGSFADRAEEGCGGLLAEREAVLGSGLGSDLGSDLDSADFASAGLASALGVAGASVAAGLDSPEVVVGAASALAALL